MAEPMDSPHLPSLVQTDHTHLRLPSRPDWIEPTVEYLRARAVLCGACHESRAGKLLVALHEALSNAIVHGNLGVSSALKEQGDSFAHALASRAADPRFAGRCVDVIVDYDGERCQWLIADEGEGFDVDAVLQRLESCDPEVLLASGRGILMMRSFLDRVHYEDGGRRCVLTMQRASGSERRGSSRLPANRPIHAVPIRSDGTVDWEAAYEAVSKNLSEDGVGLLQARLAATDRILIALATGGPPLYVPVEVRHCRPLGGNLFEVGCRFDSRAPAPAETGPREQAQQAIDSLLARLAAEQVAGDERRAHPRVVYTERVEVHLPGGAAPLAGFARDLSRGGLAFITTLPLPLRECVIRLPHHGEPPLGVRAEVVRCALVQEGFYDVGACFVGLEGG
jgi:anti-sigma regulatory factor (Ser/Thr protein kinase)